MTIVAYSHPLVVGVDTHARKHVFAIIAAANGSKTGISQRRARGLTAPLLGLRVAPKPIWPLYG
jgi:hypothetical protein